MKLGEALIREGFITKQQLTTALERQVMFGCKIGTNLIELKFISEDDLTKFLSKYFRVPPVTAEMLNDIPEEVLASVDREIVEKYKILPFKKERKRLHTAMMNPTDLKELEDLRFTTGHDIIPYAVTDFRLLFGLEKYYEIKRELRYISLTDPFDTETAAEKTESIEEIKASFADVKETEEIAGILLKEASKTAKRVAILIMKAGKIAGWKARGVGLDGFEATASGEEQSVFSEVLRARNYYRGPVLKIKGNEPLISLLSGTPQDALLMPVVVREKVVALLYVDNGNTDVLNANVGLLSKLTSLAALAFEIIILRKRILDL